MRCWTGEWTAGGEGTFITTALENGCSLEDVQRAAGHREPGYHQTLRPAGL
jgi:hypothetical protein